jgi:hypothetical protein
VEEPPLQLLHQWLQEGSLVRQAQEAQWGQGEHQPTSTDADLMQRAHKLIGKSRGGFDLREMVDVSAMDDGQIEGLLVAKRTELEKKYGTLKVGQCFFRNLLKRLQQYYPNDEFVLRIPLFIGTTSTRTTTVFEGMLMKTNNNVHTVKNHSNQK